MKGVGARGQGSGEGLKKKNARGPPNFDFDSDAVIVVDCWVGG